MLLFLVNILKLIFCVSICIIYRFNKNRFITTHKYMYLHSFSSVPCILLLFIYACFNSKHFSHTSNIPDPPICHQALEERIPQTCSPRTEHISFLSVENATYKEIHKRVDENHFEFQCIYVKTERLALIFAFHFANTERCSC